MADHQLTEWQVLLIWALAAKGGESFWRDLVGSNSNPSSEDARNIIATYDGRRSSDRERLRQAKLITVERNPPDKGKGFWLKLEESGWQAAVQFLGHPLPRSNLTGPILQAWQKHLKEYVETQNVPLADILAPRPRRPPDRRLAMATPNGYDPAAAKADFTILRDRIRGAYRQLAGGRFNCRILLSELRHQLRDLDRTVLDEALLRLQREGEASLMQLDNKDELTDADRQAAIFIGREPRHILWISQ